MTQSGFWQLTIHMSIGWTLRFTCFCLTRIPAFVHIPLLSASGTRNGSFWADQAYPENPTWAMLVAGQRPRRHAGSDSTRSWILGALQSA
ncbi:hypothetical protein J1614_006839 [Plenodomus biglobosus]|nr:hypothetical protein J1614_006839 [Plenodomus biglobosus]